VSLIIDIKKDYFEILASMCFAVTVSIMILICLSYTRTLLVL